MFLSVLDEIKAHQKVHFSDMCLRFRVKEAELNQIVEVLQSLGFIAVQDAVTKCSGCHQCPSDRLLIAQ